MISIIVPVYNVESYLRKCLDSILKQTFCDFELLLVNDGSTDGSLEICNEYAEKDSRVIVLCKKNGGLSSARNLGLEYAKGEYIGFIDSDDFVSCNFYEELYNSIIKYDADIAMSRLINCYGSIPNCLAYQNRIILYNSLEAYKEILKGEIAGVFAVNKLYRKELFIDLRYREGKTSEDAFIIGDLINRCTKVVLDENAYYYYMHRKNSITTTAFAKKDFNLIEAWNYNKENIEKNYPQLIELADMRLIWAHFFVLDKMYKTNIGLSNDDLCEMVKFLRKNIVKILFAPEFTVARKISATCLFFSKRFYRLFVAVNDKKNRALFD